MPHYVHVLETQHELPSPAVSVLLQEYPTPNCTDFDGVITFLHHSNAYVGDMKSILSYLLMSCTTPHHTASHHTTPHHTTPHPTTPHHTTPHHITPHHTTSHHITPHHITPHHTTPYHTTPYHTAPHHTTPHHTTQTAAPTGKILAASITLI